MIIKEWIKKDEVMDIIKGLPQDLWEEYIYMLKGVWCDEDMHLEALQAEPVKHGKNISENGFLCSVCSFGDFGGFHGYEPNYCPNCGAKMDKE